MWPLYDPCDLILHLSRSKPLTAPKSQKATEAPDQIAVQNDEFSFSHHSKCSAIGSCRARQMANCSILPTDACLRRKEFTTQETVERNLSAPVDWRRSAMKKCRQQVLFWTEDLPRLDRPPLALFTSAAANGRHKVSSLRGSDVRGRRRRPRAGPK